MSIYWHTGSIGTAVRIYYSAGMFRTPPAPRTVGLTLENARAARASRQQTQRASGRRVPEGYFDFYGITSRARPPRSLVEEVPEHVTLWSHHETGGHFPAAEEPRAARRGPAGVLQIPAFRLSAAGTEQRGPPRSHTDQRVTPDAALWASRSCARSSSTGTLDQVCGRVGKTLEGVGGATCLPRPQLSRGCGRRLECLSSRSCLRDRHTRTPASSRGRACR